MESQLGLAFLKHKKEHFQLHLDSTEVSLGCMALRTWVLHYIVDVTDLP